MNGLGQIAMRLSQTGVNCRKRLQGENITITGNHSVFHGRAALRKLFVFSDEDVRLGVELCREKFVDIRLSANRYSEILVGFGCRTVPDGNCGFAGVSKSENAAFAWIKLQVFVQISELNGSINEFG